MDAELKRLLDLLEDRPEAVNDPELIRRLRQLVTRCKPPAPPDRAQELPWQARMTESAETLIRSSTALSMALSTPATWQHLTGPVDDPDAIYAYRNYRREVRSALAAVIDLNYFDLPSHPYPDLSKGFAFQCANVTWQEHLDMVTVPMVT